MASLVPCSQCQRHVRRSETQCPFCGAASAPAAQPSREALLMREAKRASLIALGLALAGQACGGKEDEGKKRDNVGLVPPYGISPNDWTPDGSGGTGGGGSPGEAGQGGTYATVPPYGLSPFPNPEGGSGGAEEPDAGSPDDAGTGDTGVDAGNDPDAAG